MRRGGQGLCVDSEMGWFWISIRFPEAACNGARLPCLVLGVYLCNSEMKQEIPGVVGLGSRLIWPPISRVWIRMMNVGVIRPGVQEVLSRTCQVGRMRGRRNPNVIRDVTTVACLFAPVSHSHDTPLCRACLNCPTQLALISDSVRMSKHGVSNPSMCPPWRLAARENPPKSTTPANRQRKPNASRFLSKQVPVKRQINDKSFEGVCRGNDFAHVSALKNWLGPARSKCLNQ